MRFFHPTGRRGAFPGGFSGQLFAGRFPTRGFTGSLLGSGHFLLPKEDIRDSGAPALVPLGGHGGTGSAPLPSRLFTAADGPGPPPPPPPLMTQAARSGSSLPREGGVRGGVTSPPRRAEAPLARNPASGPLNHHREKRRRRGSGTKPQGKTSRTHTRRRQPEQPALPSQRLKPAALTADGASNHEQTRQRLPNAEVSDRFFDRRAAPAAQ